MSKESNPIRFWIGVVVLLGLSVYMIVNPEMADGAEIEGRQTLLKSLVMTIWGIPAGIIGLLLATLMIYGKVKKPKEDEENKE